MVTFKTKHIQFNLWSHGARLELRRAWHSWMNMHASSSGGARERRVSPGRCENSRLFTCKAGRLRSNKSPGQLHFYSNLVNSDPVVLNELGSHFLFEKPQCLRTLSRLDYPKRQGAFLILHAWLMAFPRQSWEECVGKPPKIFQIPRKRIFFRNWLFYSVIEYTPIFRPHSQTDQSSMGHFCFGHFDHFDPARGRHVGGPKIGDVGCPDPSNRSRLYIYNYIYIYIYISICIFCGQPMVAASPILDIVM